MPCGSRSEYRPRPGVRRRGFRGAVVLRHRAAKHCPAAALRPASVTRLLSAVFGRRGCVAWTVSPGAPCPGRPPGLPAVRRGSLSVPRAGPSRKRGACVRLCVRQSPPRSACSVRTGHSPALPQKAGGPSASGNSPEAHALCEQGILPLSRKRRAGLLRPARAYATEQGMPSASTRAAMRSSSSRPTFSSVGQGVSRSSE